MNAGLTLVASGKFFVYRICVSLKFMYIVKFKK